MRATLILVATATLAACAAANNEPAELENLTRVESANFDTLYIKPELDLGRYNQYRMEPLGVDFARGWQASQNISDPLTITDSDIATIKQELADSFRSVFTRTLEQSDKLKMTNQAGPGVLSIQPAIVNLNIINPTNNVAYQKTILADHGATMSIEIELRDSATNELLMKILDQGRTRDYTDFRQQEVVKNKSDSNKLLQDWAFALRRAMQYGVTQS